ncbi:MarR family transcriptional regulator [Massilia sp. PAMC28688]|uniref:MarR family winged helix-turn-helix transcriptional regulator n=1 Tax=Massilia sp. PAMC28688 TaxID=2861283 RepID=UPI001C62B96B|nr:MarR family transcriptional regulator [Massilia sp. PAMC28688]QYF94608.1 MarR family transcriptional regulator [Massilia sp. PAMC28688]
MKATLGTQLRHLIELLDGAVGAAYEEAGLHYRPRYTPVMRALIGGEPATVGGIAETAGITQPAATQTVALMIKDGLVAVEPSPHDARQKLIRLTQQGRELVPALQTCWRATALAAESLDADLPFPLGEVLADAIDALRAKSFGERIREARTHLQTGSAISPPGTEAV